LRQGAFLLLVNLLTGDVLRYDLKQLDRVFIPLQIRLIGVLDVVGINVDRKLHDVFQNLFPVLDQMDPTENNDTLDIESEITGNSGLVFNHGKGYLVAFLQGIDFMALTGAVDIDVSVLSQEIVDRDAVGIAVISDQGKGAAISLLQNLQSIAVLQLLLKSSHFTKHCSVNLLGFRIFHAEGLYGNRFHNLGLHRSVGPVGLNLCNAVYNVHALDDLTESRIFAV
jgi:hypothetical protein